MEKESGNRTSTQSAPSIKKGILQRVELASLAICLILISSGCTKPKTLKDEAIQMSIDVISNSLATPTTAKFSGIGIETHTNGVIFVAGNVDAQNSYGAMIRQGWMCALSNSPDGKLVYLVHVFTDK